MATAAQKVRRNGKEGQRHLGEGHIETTTIGAMEADSHQEVSVHYEHAHTAKKTSPFSWIEEFTVEWSEMFISKDQKNL